MPLIAAQARTSGEVRLVPCVDVYGPHPIATVFGMLRIKGHSC